MREIPFFSANGINTIGEYERFRHTKAYVKQKSAACLDRHDVMRKAGYVHFEKFTQHRKEFDNLNRNIPLKYLDAVAADRDTIGFCSELDMQEFLYTKDTIDLYPEYATVRIYFCIHQSIAFPPGTPEKDAVEIVRDYTHENRIRACINYVGLKTIAVEPDGRVNEIWYPPTVRFTKFWMMVHGDGRNIGKAYLR